MMEYQEIIKQLENNKAAINALLKDISPEEARWRPADNRWTVLEIINHLIDIEKEDFRFEFEMILQRPDDRWPGFSIEKWRVERKYNSRDYNDSIKEFQNERNKSIKWLKKIEKPDLSSIHKGKGFKGKDKMKAGDVLASWVAHDLFHIRQLTLVKWYLLNEAVKPFSSSYSGFKI